MYDGTRYLVLFVCEKDGFIYNRIRYVTSVKSDIRYVISHNYPKIKVYWYNSLPLEKTVTFHNVIVVLKSFNLLSFFICSVISQDNSSNYCKLLFQKASYELPKKIIFCIKYKW